MRSSSILRRQLTSQQYIPAIVGKNQLELQSLLSTYSSINVGNSTNSSYSSTNTTFTKYRSFNTTSSTQHDSLLPKWTFGQTRSSTAGGSAVSKKGVNEKELSLVLDKYAKYSPSPLSVQNFIDFASSNTTEYSSYMFLRKEMAVRLANIIKEIAYLPPKLLEMPSVQLVQSWYLLSMSEVLEFVKRDETEHSNSAKKFTETVIKIRNRHNTVVQTMAEGILELKACSKIDASSDAAIQYFLDRFYMMRISIRMLLLQHIFISEQREGTGFISHETKHPRFVGLIDPKCVVSDIIEDAYENARYLCEEYYLTAPELELREEINWENNMRSEKHTNGEQQNGGESRNSPLTIAYIPSHLHHIAFELFKNALRATVEYHGRDCKTLPPVSVTIAHGPKEISIKISDRGGGFPHHKTNKLFKYLYTTASLPNHASHGAETTPLAGYGYGLPLSRIYARYFNGDLVLCPQEGLGADALIYLNALSANSFEQLPVFNAATRRQYTSPHLSSDWTKTPGQEEGE